MRYDAPVPTDADLRAAAEQRIPCFTSIDTAHHAVAAMVEGSADYNIATVSEYTAGRVAVV